VSIHPTLTIVRLGMLCFAAAALAFPAAATASRTQESVLQDDPQLLGASPAQLDQRLSLLKAIGVDRLRVSVFWGNIAPASTRQSKPNFPAGGPRDPRAYPQNSWRPYDNIAITAKKHGLDLLFTLTGPAPAWATPGVYEREGLNRPSARDFREFATAVGVRYSGLYPVDDRFPVAQNPIKIGPIEIGGTPPEQPAARLPRVDAYSIWNEPNYPSWLRPIWVENRPRRARDMVAAAPHHYRRLVDAAWAGLSDSGHAGALFLIGETSPRGAKKPSSLGNAMPPAEFARELYCVRSNFRPYTGRAAALRDCPRNAGERRAFRGRHPGLFRSSGYAHHPYSLDTHKWKPPTWRHPIKDNVPLANMGRLIRTLDRAILRWGGGRRRTPIWITEYGYQTKPPDPLIGVAPSRQGPLTTWGEYMAYRNPRVASIAQFLYVDDGPVPGFFGRDPRRWISWQSGLYSRNMRPKPALTDYLRPIHVSQRGRRVRVFGGYRPAATGVSLSARLDYAPRGAGWEPLRNFRVNNRRGYLSTTARVRRAGQVRLVWRDPATRRLVASRSVTVK
jgi:hypothetical protein